MKLLGLFLIRCVFTKNFWEAKNLLKPEPERIEAFRNTVHWLFCDLQAFSQFGWEGPT